MVWNCHRHSHCICNAKWSDTVDDLDLLDSQMVNTAFFDAYILERTRPIHWNQELPLSLWRISHLHVYCPRQCQWTYLLLGNGHRALEHDPVDSLQAGRGRQGAVVVPEGLVCWEWNEIIVSHIIEQEITISIKFVLQIRLRISSQVILVQVRRNIWSCCCC